MSMSWRDSTAPLPLFPCQHTDELPFVAHWVKSQPLPKPVYRAPLWRFIVSLAVAGAPLALAVAVVVAMGK